MLSALAKSALPLITLVVLTTIPAASFAQEYQRFQTTEGGPYAFWRNRIISYSLDVNGCPDIDLGQTRSAVVRSFNTWESQACTDIFFNFAGYVDSVLPNQFTHEVDGINLVIWLDEWPVEWGIDQIANTRPIWNERTGEILEVDIVLNGQDYYWTASSTTVTDIENVLVHEIGHLLGFEHTTDPDATMYLGYNEGEILKRDLDATDIRGLCEVYPSGRPTPDMPDLGLDDLELSSGGCECSTLPPRPLQGAPWLALLIVALLFGSRAKRGRNG